MSEILTKKPESGQTVLIVCVVIIQNLIVSNFEEKHQNSELNCILRDFIGQTGDRPDFRKIKATIERG